MLSKFQYQFSELVLINAMLIEMIFKFQVRMTRSCLRWEGKLPLQVRLGQVEMAMSSKNG